MEQVHKAEQVQQAIRARKGQEIATKQRITKRGPVWVVPSQSHGGSYVVENDGVKFSCTCPDHELRQQPCKHVLAVEIVRTHSMPDGTIVQETLRVTYSQDWSNYNLAKTHDKERTELLLRDLCKLIVEPEQQSVPHADRVRWTVLSRARTRRQSDWRLLHDSAVSEYRRWRMVGSSAADRTARSGRDF